MDKIGQMKQQKGSVFIGRGGVFCVLNYFKNLLSFSQKNY